MDKLIPQRLLHEGLFSSASLVPNKTALIVEGKSYTYAQLLDAVIRLSNVIIEQGFSRGDRCVIYMDNTWFCVVSIYATLLSGGCFVVVNPQTKNDKLEYILNDSSASILLTDSHLSAVFSPVIAKVPSLKGIVCSGDTGKLNDSNLLNFSQAIKVASSQSPQSTIINKDLAALIYTSGSTGQPKGVMQTHSSMLFALESLIEYLRLSGNDKILVVLPMAFDYGLYQLLMSVQSGATLVLERSFTYPAQIFNRIEESGVTVFPAVPTIFSMLMTIHARSPISFPGITKVTNTAAALPADYISTLKEIFPSAIIFKMYGLTECKRVCYLEPEKIDQKPTSVGQAIPGTEVFILDKNGMPVTFGEAGILHVRGSHIMSGYWKQPDLTEAVLVDSSIYGEKILRTGDWFKQDEDGDLYFVGRSDDIIKTRGEKVSPVEVENVIHGIAGVSETAVIGVADEIFGEAIKCFVALEKGADLKLRDIKKVCVKKLENFMVPKYFELVDALPKTETGKISKKGLK